MQAAAVQRWVGGKARYGSKLVLKCSTCRHRNEAAGKGGACTRGQHLPTCHPLLLLWCLTVLPSAHVALCQRAPYG